MHFRWGDVATGNADRVTGRTGYALSKFRNLVLRLLQWEELAGRSRVHFFSEGEDSDFASLFQGEGQAALSGITSLYLGEASKSHPSVTFDDLDVMAHADILIGGRSSFLSLASQLAGRQQILVADPEYAKFMDHGTSFYTRMLSVEQFDGAEFKRQLTASQGLRSGQGSATQQGAGEIRPASCRHTSTA